MKKILKTILILLAILGLSSTTLAPSVLAEGEDSQTTTKSESKRTMGSCTFFLGLTSWDCNVTNIEDEESIKTNIWLIASNIANDIAIIAVYLVLGYTIYGGYLYTFSGGDPGKVANGKKTLAQAFIGLAITLSASVIMASIRIALVGNSGNIGNCATAEDACVTAENLIINLVNWFISIAGVASVIFLVYGGILYTTSAGDAGKAQRARQMIFYALIGLVIVALSFSISAFVSNIIREANKNAIIFNQTNLLKGGK